MNFETVNKSRWEAFFNDLTQEMESEDEAVGIGLAFERTNDFENWSREIYSFSELEAIQFNPRSGKLRFSFKDSNESEAFSPMSVEVARDGQERVEALRLDLEEEAEPVSIRFERVS